MGYDIFSPIVLDIQIWVSFGPILEWRQNEELGMGYNITVLKTGLKNELITPKNIVIEFDLFITVGI